MPTNRIARYFPQTDPATRLRQEYDTSLRKLRSLYVLARIVEGVPGEPYGMQIDGFWCPPEHSQFIDLFYRQLERCCEIRQRMRGHQR